MDVTVLLRNVAVTTGEGPHWDEQTTCLYHVDINCGDVHCWESVTGESSKVRVDGNVGFAIPRKSRGCPRTADLVIGHGLKFEHLNWSSGTTTVIAEDPESKAFRINDGKCDVTGRLWAGTMQKTRRPLEEEPQRCGALYSLESDGRLVKRLEGISLSNGLAWSPDNKTMFYIDSIPRTISVFDFDQETGNIANQRVLRAATDGSLGLPDGMSCDAEGKLWVACYGEGKLARLDPETGQTIQEVPIPQAKLVTSCCFGGPDLADLFVTSKRYGIPDEEFNSEQPLAGSVFRVRGLGVKGLPSYSYAG